MDWPMMVFGRAAVALLIEKFTGYPQAIHSRISHPVVWAGRLITYLDQKLNKPNVSPLEGRARGVAALAILISAAFFPAWMIADILSHWRLGWVVEVLLATTLIAQRSLKDHVLDVHQALGRSLPEARRSVSMIVGRDTTSLDESGISRAALESLAENSSDGIVAPVLWYALLGLPGIAIYKAINTADSMIGHKNARYQWFGWASARLDDVVNLPASRLTGLLFAACTPSRFREIVAIMRRDAPKHQSPNAGWPEAAMATALGLRLGGPRSYQGDMLELPWMGEGRTTLTRGDILSGVKLMTRAMLLLSFALLFVAIV